MQRRYFGTDGIRGRVGELPITPEFVLHLGWAAGKVLGNEGRSSILIGKDTRISGYLLESALEAGLSAAGVDIRLLGPMPTPGIAYLTRTLHARAGIVISASHNLYNDNGIKFFSSDGYKLPDGLEEKIEYQLSQPIQCVDSARLGKATRVMDAGGRYIEFCKGTVPPLMDLRGIRIALDCANGATYHIAPHVFEELGADVVIMGNRPNGLNINDNCGSTQPGALQQLVLDECVDIGIAMDGDGDRLVMVDRYGELLDGDDILFIIARSRKATESLKSEKVVGTLMSNLGLEQALNRLGIGFERTKVGDRYVLEKLREEGAILGGEPSGHIICLDRTSTGDGIVSALQVIAEMKRTDKSLSELKNGIEKYPQTLVNIRTSKNSFILQDSRMKRAIMEAESELKGKGRVLVRNSGTEPLVRIMVECKEAETVERITKQLAARVAEFVANETSLVV